CRASGHVSPVPALMHRQAIGTSYADETCSTNVAQRDFSRGWCCSPKRAGVLIRPECRACQTCVSSHVRHGGFFSVYPSSMLKQGGDRISREQLSGGDMSYEYRSALKRVVVIAAAAATSSIAIADADLDQKIADPSNWAAQAGDYSNHRYSELKQINTSN